jgi:tetratricopeptide (TPR) repeat protein
LESALALRKQEEAICRQLGDLDGLARSVGDQALILEKKGQLDRALSLARESERIGRELGNLAVIQAALGNQAFILLSQRELNEAMKLAKEQERVCRTLSHQRGLGQSLSVQAAILQHNTDWQGAANLYTQAAAVYRSIGYSRGLLATLFKHAAIMFDHHWEAAVALLAQGEVIARELDQLKPYAARLESEAIAVRGKGVALREAKQFSQAMFLLMKCEGFWRELGDMRALGQCLGNQGNILWDTGNTEAALGAYKQVEEIGRRLGDNESVTISLLNMARLIAEDLNRPDQAQPLAEEGLRLASAAGSRSLEELLRSLVQSLRRQELERWQHCLGGSGSRKRSRGNRNIQEALEASAEGAKYSVRLFRANPMEELMRFFKRLFGGSSSTTERASSSSIQSRLEREFGLHFGDDGRYSFKGKVFEKGSGPGMEDPEVVFGVLKKFRERFQFDRIVLLIGKRSGIACNSQPPILIETALRDDGPAGTAIAEAAIKAGAKLVGEYKGAFIFQMM